LPEPPLQYADFAVWQRQYLVGSTFDSQLDYWRTQAHNVPVLELPLDRLRPAVQSYRGAHLDLALSRPLTTRLHEWSQGQGVTLFMTLLAAFAVLLSRYSGQSEIVVGSPISGRNRPELETIVGFFVNHLVLRIDLSGEPSFRDVVRRVRQITLEAYEHQDLPFDKLVAELHPNRDLSRNPLFQVTFQIVNTPGISTPESVAPAMPVDVEQGTAIFDLAVNAWESPDGLRARFEYSTDLFDHISIERMTTCYQRLLAGALENPDLQVSLLALCNADEERLLLEEWNRTEVAYRNDVCLHQLFEEQVRRTPRARALVDGAEWMTFEELNRDADHLAGALAARGIGPGSLVAVALDRSPGMVAALLGALKVGAAYLPLDLTYPRDRIEFMLNDACAALLISESSVLERLSLRRETPLFRIDADWPGEIPELRPRPAAATPEDLAYVIYTSGSTGTPKGAMIHHAAVCNHMQWMQERFPLSSDDRVLQRTPFSFDASVWEFYAPLISGATLVLVPQEARRDARALVGVIAEKRVTILQVVPSLLKLLLDVPEFAGCTTLRRVFCGGEPLTNDLVTRFREQCAAELINLYGPTEATIDTHCFVCSRDDNDRMIPIGKAIANTRSYILDEQLRPTPIGVPGELYIGGRAVGKGYLNRPELTASRFIADPFVPSDGARLYRTGDRARYLPDGNIHLIGRIDQQVKLRGFRIELGEIEAVLRACDGVSDAVACIRDDHGGPRLVAYVVPEGAFPGVSEVRRYLKERVPEYMVPAAVVVLERMPLTANGKVDRGALPAPEGVRPELATAYVAPRTAVEEMLAGIWGEVLGLERVGIADNFFELGGDSILSIQIIARARQAGWQITPQQLFQQQTVGELAAVAVPLQSEAEAAVTGAVPLLPVQAWFFEQAFADAQHFNQAVLLPLPAGTARDALQAALAAVAAHHDALRLRFSETATGWQGRCAAEATAVCEEWDLTGLTGAAQAAAEQAAMARVQGSLDLEAGPLTRMAVLRRGAAGDRLLWVVHHLAVDGVSWRILLEDLQTALGQGARGEAVVLPARTSSIRRWGERLQAYARDAALGDAAYWRGQQTADAPLPRDLEGGANTVAAERTLMVELDEEETRGVLQEVPALWHTQINDALLTALLETYAAWTGRSVLRIDLEGHGREDLFAGVDVSRTVGWFTSIFPVWLHREAAGDLAATLRGVKEQLRAIPTRGLSYGVLRYLGPAPLREQLAGPRAAISMNYLGQFAPGTRPAPLAPADANAAATGPLRSPRAHRAYLLEINAAVLGGQLRVYWTYSTAYHTAATIERLAGGFLDTLRALIRLGRTVDAPRYTPSDFPHARLTQNELDAVLAEIGPAEGGSVA
jgi:amino acid adenylation domain-containing protein/non-ribosomal peptide synthase protein (TIGR01720 family)